MTEPIELKTVDSMPGSMNEFISTNKRLRRPPSLSESFAWEPENVARAMQQPLVSPPPEEQATIQPPPLPLQHWKYEQYACEVIIKLLLHISLISVFETLFYFLYVSALENNGIIKTVSAFIDGAAERCENMTPTEIDLVDDLLEPFLNASQIVAAGNQEEAARTTYNKSISNQAWYYVAGLTGIFIVAIGYVKKRKIVIAWRAIVLENVAMVCLLALYELMFFDTIIYPYEPISTKEIGRNAVQKLQNVCGLLEY
jgi:hypothetical protein